MLVRLTREDFFSRIRYFCFLKSIWTNLNPHKPGLPVYMVFQVWLILEKEIWRDKEGYTESLIQLKPGSRMNEYKWTKVLISFFYSRLYSRHHCHARNTSILLYTRVKSVGRIRPQILVIFQTICSANSWIIRWISKSCINVAAEL